MIRLICDSIRPSIGHRFHPTAAAVAQRLDTHVKQIIGQVVVDGSNSLEILYAFVLLGPYLVSLPLDVIYSID